MTNEQRKEPEKLFDEICSSFTGDGNHYIEYVSKDAFLETVANLYSEIEAREKKLEVIERDLSHCNGEYLKTKRVLVDKLQRLEEIIKAADEVIVKASGMISTTKPMAIRSFAVWGELNKALEKYRKLKI